jgi:site-specific DNA-cytosine methylase
MPMPERPTFLSLFSGIQTGGLDLGLERAGWQCVGQVEIDPFCQAVLAKQKTLVYAPVTFTFASGGKQVEDRWLPKDPTADPCPRCDGRVELIPGDTS